jgi:hypothetical protein
MWASSVDAYCEAEACVSNTARSSRLRSISLSNTAALQRRLTKDGARDNSARVSTNSAVSSSISTLISWGVFFRGAVPKCTLVFYNLRAGRGESPPLDAASPASNGSRSERRRELVRLCLRNIEQ